MKFELQKYENRGISGLFYNGKILGKTLLVKKDYLSVTLIAFVFAIPSLVEAARTQCNYPRTSAAQCGDKVRTDSRHLGEMRLSVFEEVLLLDLNAVLNQKRSVLLGKSTGLYLYRDLYVVDEFMREKRVV